MQRRRSAYREDAAAVVGSLKLLQGAGELSGAKLGPVDHWGDAGETARGWACVTRVLSFARACRLHVGLWRLQLRSGEVCGVRCVLRVTHNKRKPRNTGAERVCEQSKVQARVYIVRWHPEELPRVG